MFTTTHSIRSDDSETDDAASIGSGGSSEDDEVHAEDINTNVTEACSDASERPTDETKSSSLLKNLPPELRSQMLWSMPDLPSLRALVRASPILHAQYRESRNTILRARLDRELDGFYVDAQATLMSRASVLGYRRTDRVVKDFSDSYRQRLVASVPRSRVGSTEPGAIRWLAAYHLSVARPLLRMYGEWALENLEKLAASVAGSESTTTVTETGSERGANLSRSEEIRILRAL
ncbi:hypothetical protein CMUS01_02942 [Colletotrichum musicola]|uniref:Uncharacterized protein n=1 Tax=Colletotrichum musicola TaxID=2175873 RepID=A0A8H6NU52_9PEZI|nr:hypothetical protein CMUS01_02942 [Colletotrichum musicola]